MRFEIAKDVNTYILAVNEEEVYRTENFENLKDKVAEYIDVRFKSKEKKFKEGKK